MVFPNGTLSRLRPVSRVRALLRGLAGHPSVTASRIASDGPAEAAMQRSRQLGHGVTA